LAGPVIGHAATPPLVALYLCGGLARVVGFSLRAMTSAQIRQSFLDFFREKGHTVVPSSSLLPDSPNLLFTNAGMNQFVPIFLGERRADVSKWAGAVPGSDTRAADTQKCIRAGGKHNDLDDVGLDTYHHTFFEMLGNWSFGDYFKKEAIDWAWELVVERWGLPADRLYATIYQPDKSVGDPAERDEKAWALWAEKFRAKGLDPAVHIVNGNKKDNFWMMGDTGPCGPCSELHVDLTPVGDTRGALVNRGDARCIEIWNLVFIQFNANPDGTFSPLPAQHVDTGMGFERVASIIQGTKNFADFANAKISNYETDIFRPIFDEIETLSGKRYASTLPVAGSTGDTEQEKIDVAFRVIADHIRTLSFAIADGIPPGNTDRNYVLRRILRRAVRYGRTLGFHEPFFYQLVPVLAREMGDVFPELRARQKQVEETLQREEEAFNRTLDKGIELFAREAANLLGSARMGACDPRISGAFAFRLYDEQGFPLDLTELMARERGLAVDTAGFETLMEEQRARARAAQKKQVIELSEVETTEPTLFLGYDALATEARVLKVLALKDKTAVVLDASVCYAEMGGQVGDSGEFAAVGRSWQVTHTQKVGQTWLHVLAGDDAPEVGAVGTLNVEKPRREAIQRHHTVTHLLHAALHEIVSAEATQKGSFVGPEKLTFDFNGAPLTPDEVRAVEKRVNERITENAPVSWTEVAYADVRGRADIMQFFGDKYGETVRVVQIGGTPGQLDGYSMELCAGTHTGSTGDITAFKIVSEGAIAAGVRRIEAVAGGAVREWAAQEAIRQDEKFAALARKKPGLPALPMPGEGPDGLAARTAHLEALETEVRDWEKLNVKAAEAEAKVRAAEVATDLAASATDSCVAEVPEADGKFLQAVVEALRPKFAGPIFLAGVAGGRVALIAAVPKELTGRLAAGKLIQEIAPLVGGKGGGRPDLAQGGGTDPSQLAAALARARELLGP
jgi:alanyl-tRNA synthetase